MDDRLKNLILRRLVSFPGIVGIASMNFDKSNQPLEETKFKEGILIQKVADGFIISIALIIKHNINSIIVAREITFTITNILNKEKNELLDLKIYIRGIN